MKTKKIVGLLILCQLTGCIIKGSWVNSFYEKNYYIEKKTESFIGGKPLGKATVIKLWIQKDRIKYFKSDDKDSYLIIRMDEEKAYQINHNKKTVKKMDLKERFAAIEKEIQVASKKTGKKKKINKWDAYQVLITSVNKGKSTEVEYWLSDEIELPIETRLQVADYFGQRKIIEELKKYPGYPVETRVHLKIEEEKIEMITRLEKFEKKKIEDHLFKIPLGYQEIAFPLFKKAPEPNISLLD